MAVRQLAELHGLTERMSSPSPRRARPVARRRPEANAVKVNRALLSGATARVERTSLIRSNGHAEPQRLRRARPRVSPCA
jgi:hypothetical protein